MNSDRHQLVNDVGHEVVKGYFVHVDDTTERVVLLSVELKGST